MPGFAADYSLQSLDELEGATLARYESIERFDEERLGEFVTGASRYYGETMCEICLAAGSTRTSPAVMMS